MAELDHIGLAVRDAEAVGRLFERLFGIGIGRTERVDDQGVAAHFVESTGAQLELLEALRPDSPVARFLDRRGEGIHHLAFRVTGIREHLRRVRDLGFTPLSDAPVEGAGGKLTFFLHPKDTHGMLIEFCERLPEKGADA